MSAQFIIAVVTHTPLWVWALLAALVALGLSQTRDQVLTAPRLLAQPLGMGAYALFGATQAFGWHAGVQPMWLLGLALGFGLNHWLRLPRRMQALPDGRFAIGGSWTPLALIVGVFSLRYLAAVSIALTPQLAHQPWFAALASALYGLPIGLLAARAVRVLKLRQRASGWVAA